MFEIQSQNSTCTKSLLIGIFSKNFEKIDALDLLMELEELVKTLGIPIVGQLLIHNREPSSHFLIGSGNTEKIVKTSESLGSNLIIFDTELSPAQEKNWEKIFPGRVMDRQEVILDIFAHRAKTREAQIQVNLARLSYSLPRLTRAWSHFGQQGGGIGSKGEGESQLEQDKRSIKNQIDRLKNELIDIQCARSVQRKKRQKFLIPHAAIVGYTNAGKSSLMKSLTGVDVLIEDALFVTLDTKTRKMKFSNNKKLLITDTVGFIRKLPHDLIKSFHATLEESVMADFLIHLLDASHPRVIEFYNTTVEVLLDLGANIQKMLTVFNKIDRVLDPLQLAFLRGRYPNAIFISVKSGDGMSHLRKVLEQLIDGNTKKISLCLPYDRQDLLIKLYKNNSILDIKSEEEVIICQVVLSKDIEPLFEKFIMYLS